MPRSCHEPLPPCTRACSPSHARYDAGHVQGKVQVLKDRCRLIVLHLDDPDVQVPFLFPVSAYALRSLYLRSDKSSSLLILRYRNR